MNYDNTFINSDIKILNEESFYKEDKINIMIQIDNNRNYGLDMAYFKLYNDSDYTKATKSACIKLFKSEYVPEHADGKKNWILNNKEKRRLLEILTSSPNISNYKNKNMTVWESMVKYVSSTGIKMPDDISMPDYNLL